MANSKPTIDHSAPVLVTGASGFIGSRIVRRLLRDGMSVTGMVEELTPQHLRLLDQALEGDSRDRVPLLVCDLHNHREALAIVEELRPAACIHTAWNVKPGVYRDSPDNDRWVETSLQLIDALLDNGCTWFVVLGTCFETADSSEANSVYARAKATLRHEAQSLVATHPGSRLCWLHIFQPYGPGEHPARLFPALIDACINRSHFTIKTGNSVRDFIHIDDIARAISLALRNRAGGTFEVGTGCGRSVAEVAEWIADLLDSRDLLEVQPPLETAQADVIIADPRPLEKATGWRPRIDFAAAIKHQIAEAMVRPDAHARRGSARCPVCGSADNTPICAAVDQPAMLNLLHRSQEQAVNSPRTKFRFVGCHNCGFVFNDRFDPQTVAYTPEYVNDQTHSAVFTEHCRAVRDRLAELVRSRPGRIIECGCGQGGFLRSLCEQSERNGIGFDPACTAERSDRVDVKLVLEEFTPDHAKALEHLSDPVAMLWCIREIAATGNALLYLETPSFDWIARRGAFFDFSNEHCSLFTAGAMGRALSNAGFTMTRITESFGGQYLCIEADADGRDYAHSNHASAAGEADLHHVARQMIVERMRVAEIFDDALARGAVFLWGAAAKSVSLAAHLGLDSRRVPHFIDINPDKQDRYVPITSQRVIAPEELPKVLAGLKGEPTIAVTNPNYADEIAGCLKAMDVRADMIVLTEKDQIEPHG